MEYIIATSNGNREMTTDEIAEYTKTIEDTEAQRILELTAVEEAKAAKAVLLEKLGITEAEAKLLLS